MRKRLEGDEDEQEEGPEIGQSQKADYAALQRRGERVVLLIGGFAAHKSSAGDCQGVDIVEGIGFFSGEFILVIWLSTTRHHIFSPLTQASSTAGRYVPF